MSKFVRARYEDGVLKPLGRIDLKEGEEVFISIEERGRSLVELIKDLRDETPKVEDPVKVLEEMRK
ncbi:hypothetical protein IPA_07505 [Ignicoccus pacificus DSM 13166]|uniref:Antitoxin n=1 Tax=Ignicoccus pacificus DSM 13166 TaxID=940294 RepID=A0A977K9X3_9CREN|nr:hypothetical protein IPA_07505 [Ignicoccus pacificus DSM 13166]